MAEDFATFAQRYKKDHPDIGQAGTPVDMSPNAVFIRERFGGGRPAPGQVAPEVSEGVMGAIIAGLQGSTSGLALRGEVPDVQLREDAPWQERLASNAAGLVGDVPAILAGAVAGTGVGGALGGITGGFVVPMALREALMEAYTDNSATSWEHIWEITKAAITGGGKGAILAGATVATGGAAGLAARAMGGKAMSIGLSKFAGELTGLTTAATTLEGHMPTWQDFMDNAILLGGIKGAVKVATRLRTVYSETGKTPEQVAAEAEVRPELKEALVGDTRPALKIGDEIFEAREGEVTHGQILGRLTREQPKKIAPEDMGEPAIESGFISKGKYLTRDEALEQLGVENTQPGVGRRVPVVDELPPDYTQLAVGERIKAAVDVEKIGFLDRIRKQVMGEKDVPKLGESDTAADPVKYAYMTDEATVLGVWAEMQGAFKKAFDEQKRGVRTNAMTAEAAARGSADNATVEGMIGHAANAEQLMGAGWLMRGVTERAYKIINEMSKKPPEEQTTAMQLEAIAALEQVELFSRIFGGLSSEAGRALQIHRALKRTPFGLDMAKDLLNQYEKAKGVSPAAIAKMAAGLKDPAQMVKFAKNIVKATKFEMVLEAWKSAILSGPQTHMANIIGNLTKLIVEIPESVIVASIEAARMANMGTPMKFAQWKARAFAPVYGMMLGAKDGMTVAWEVLKHSGPHMEKADVFRTAIPGKAGEVVRFSFRALQAMDAVFRTPAERGMAHVLAVDRVIKEGVHDPRTAEFRKDVAKYVETPEAGLTAEAGLKVLKQIQHAGAEAVFAQRLGPGFEMIQRGIAGSVVQFIAPFVRTPVNLVSWAVQHTPGMNLLSARWRADFAEGGAGRSRALARVAIGTGIAMLANSLVEDGLLTGGGMFDSEQNRTKRAAGWQPYSILIGDKYYSFQRIEPIAKVLGLVADFKDMIDKSSDEEDKAKMGAMLVAMFGNATVSTTYLSGLSGTIQAVTDPERYGEGWIEQYASSLVPKIIGQTVAAADPYKREVDGAMDAIAAQLPYFRQKLMPKRDAWGKPVEEDKWFHTLPIATAKVDHDKVKNEAVRLEVAIKDAPKSFTERGPFKPKDKQVKLNSEERDIFREVAGKTAMEYLSPIVNSPDWKGIPDYAKAALYKKVLMLSRKRGAYAALPPDAAARRKVQDKIINEIMRQSEAVGQ